MAGGGSAVAGGGDGGNALRGSLPVESGVKRLVRHAERGFTCGIANQQRVRQRLVDDRREREVDAVGCRGAVGGNDNYVRGRCGGSGPRYGKLNRCPVGGEAGIGSVRDNGDAVGGQPEGAAECSDVRGLDVAARSNRDRLACALRHAIEVDALRGELRSHRLSARRVGLRGKRCRGRGKCLRCGDRRSGTRAVERHQAVNHGTERGRD